MTADVLRYPCACEIESAADSCPHVDAAVAKILGKKWDHVNAIIEMEIAETGADPRENDS